MSPGQIAAAIGGLDPAAFSGRAFRRQAIQWQYSQPGAGARMLGGRWNPPGSFATLYLALSEEAAAAELRRLAARSGRKIDDFMPRHLLEYEIGLGAILDLTDAGNRDAIGLSEREIRSDDAAPCQEVGEAAHHLGREGILAPSAAGHGDVLAVFVERLQPTSRLDVTATTVWKYVPSGDGSI